MEGAEKEHGKWQVSKQSALVSSIPLMTLTVRTGLGRVSKAQVNSPTLKGKDVALGLCACMGRYGVEQVPVVLPS